MTQRVEMKNIVASVFFILYLFQGLTRVPGATLGQEWQYISVKVSHQNMTKFSSGDILTYNLVLQHRGDNISNSYDVTAKLYLPRFITFRNCTECPKDIAVTVVKGHVIIKFEVLNKGQPITLNFTTVFDAVGELRVGYHRVITPIEVTWYNQYQTVQGQAKGAGKMQVQPKSADLFGLEIPGCSQPLGMTDGSIKMHQLVASTSALNNRPDSASFGKNGWCALRTDKNPFIQVIMSTKTRVTKVVTWSRIDKAHWVSEYVIQYSQDNVDWINYSENGFSKHFPGNTDVSEPVTHWLLYPFEANFVRLLPVKKNVMACMRFELFGCSVSAIPNCIHPIGFEDGKIPDLAISDDLNAPHNPPSNVRLNKPVTKYPFGWMAGNSGPPTYIQVDLGSIFKVTRLAIQGSNIDPPFYVKDYNVSTSNTSLAGDWTFVTDRLGKNVTFNGPQDEAQAKYPYSAFMPQPVHGRYFRLFPGRFHTFRVMRMEIYGCVADPLPRIRKPLPTDFKRRSVLLDQNNNFYACLNKHEGHSCYFTDDGKKWNEVHEEVVNVLAYNKENQYIYGLGRDLNYMYSRNLSNRWTYISREEWSKVKKDSSVVHATAIDDVFVDKEPPQGKLQWTSNKGLIWGVSGRGIHMKERSGDQWQLAASWKCCGQ